MSCKKVSPAKLLHPHRLDIAAKHAYARLREQSADLKFAKELYSNHIIAMTEGYEKSPLKESHWITTKHVIPISPLTN